MIGGGMQNFTTFCAFPALCNACGRLVEVNLLDKAPACPSCKSTDVIPYDDKALIRKAGKYVVASWNMPDDSRHLSLTDGKYLCPSCRKYHLTFLPGKIMWD